MSLQAEVVDWATHSVRRRYAASISTTSFPSSTTCSWRGQCEFDAGASDIDGVLLERLEPVREVVAGPEMDLPVVAPSALEPLFDVGVDGL